MIEIYNASFECISSVKIGSPARFIQREPSPYALYSLGKVTAF